MANFNWPAITASSAPIQYELDGSPTIVSQDTVTPANSNALPVINLNPSGTPIDPATETTLLAVDTKVGSVIQTGAGNTFFLVGGRDGGPNSRAIHVDVNGDVQVDLASSLPAGTNNIGDVDVLSLPSLPAGTNNIGDVDVLTLPPLPAGTNNIGDVDVLTLPSLPAGTNNIGDVDVLTLPPLPAGTNNIGDVDVLTLPVAYNAGTASATTLRVIPASDYVPPAPAVPAALTVKQAALTVGTSAVRLTTDASAPSATRRKLQFIIEPGGADNFFVGSSSVTSSGSTRGIRVYPGTLYTYDNDAGDYFIISDTAAQTVFVIEQE